MIFCFQTDSEKLGESNMVMTGMAEKREKKRGTNKIGLLVVAFFVLFVEKGVMVRNSVG